MTATLEGNLSAHDFASMLPLHDIAIDNYANNEKISDLPRKLTEEGSGPFGNEQLGDLCYYAPWGNLAFFYAGYHWSRGLIRLGRIDGSFGPLLMRGQFSLHIDFLREETGERPSIVRAPERPCRRLPYAFLPPLPVLPHTALL